MSGRGSAGHKAARLIGETRDLKPAILQMCRLFGLHVAHFRPARTKDGWRTAVEGDGEGFPDFVIVGVPGRGVLWRETKTLGRKPTVAQRTWLQRLRDAGEDADVWTGEDLLSGRIERELKWLAGKSNGR